MQVGIDSFAAAHDDASLAVNPSERLRNLVEQYCQDIVLNAERNADTRHKNGKYFQLG
jgi:hypothetical protein